MSLTTLNFSVNKMKKRVFFYQRIPRNACFTIIINTKYFIFITCLSSIKMSWLICVFVVHLFAVKFIIIKLPVFTIKIVIWKFEIRSNRSVCQCKMALCIDKNIDNNSSQRMKCLRQYGNRHLTLNNFLLINI